MLCSGAAAYSVGALRGAGALGACRYANVSAPGRHIVSEHVPFHACLARHGVRMALLPWFATSCAAWETRHSARRIFALPNGSVVFAGFGAQKEEQFRRAMEHEHAWRFPRAGNRVGKGAAPAESR